jgi:hypothetical protein
MPALSGLAVVLLATAGTLVVAAALKSYCLTDWQPGRQPKTCYNDIQTLWYSRDMAAHVAPYQGAVSSVVENGHRVVTLGAGQIEYPALTGIFAWLTALPVTGAASFLVVSALALAPFALFTAAALYQIAGRRALIFALSPQLAAYAFLNWDLLPVAACAGALWAWRRDRYALAGVALGLGASAKIWPGFLVLPFLIALILARSWPGAVRLVTGAVASTLAVNLPFLLVNASGWAGPYVMQSARINDKTTNSIWYWLLDPTQTSLANLLSGLAVLVAWAAALAAGYARRHQPGGYPAVQVGAVMVTSYIVLGRVDSPQYGLWVLPFLVLLAVPRTWLLLFVVSDLWLWLQWSWLWGGPDWLMATAMIARPLVLAGLALAFLRAPDVSSQPSSTVTTTGAATARTPSIASMTPDGGTAALPGT